MVQAAFAQAPAPAVKVACPPQLDLSYSKLKALDFGIPNTKDPTQSLDLTGFEPAFVPARVRLMFAYVGPVADATGDFSTGMADNEERAKPGEALIYTLWPAEEKSPPAPSAITCTYEGGFHLQRTLAATTRRCTSVQATQKAPASDRSTRVFTTKAEFSCR